MDLGSYIDSLQRKQSALQKELQEIDIALKHALVASATASVKEALSELAPLPGESKTDYVLRLVDYFIRTKGAASTKRVVKEVESHRVDLGSDPHGNVSSIISRSKKYQATPEGWKHL